MDFPGGTVDKNLPAYAGDTGLIPGLGRSHMLQIPAADPYGTGFSYWAYALEPESRNCWAPEPRTCAPQEKPLQWEASAPHLEEYPLLSATWESLCAAANKYNPMQPKINK